MPVYMYKCNLCKKEFGVFGERTELDSPEYEACCPNCKSRNTFKIVAQSSFQLKGNGWAKDGYQKNKEA